MTYPTVPTDTVPVLATTEMREVDRLMIDEVGIDLIQMMENAGRSLADLVVSNYRPASVTVLAGSGGNGGGGLAAARHLTNRGVFVRLCTTRPSQPPPQVPEPHRNPLRQVGGVRDEEPRHGDLVIAAILGYALQGDPTGRAGDLVQWVCSQSAAVVSLDGPSGVDFTTGLEHEPHVRADSTLTLALPKKGLLRTAATGRVFVADISVPSVVWDAIGVDPGGLFNRSSLIELV